MAVTRCDSCLGRKHYMGLGGMQKKCDACHGVGYVSIPEVVVKRRRVVKPVDSVSEEN